LIKNNEIIFAHSPDADDAFMFYGLAKEVVRIDNFKIGHLMEDIQTLNEKALKGELQVTAISAANYPNVVNNYRIMSCGASIGRNYGPIVVSKKPLKMNDLDGTKIAVPGIYTTSWMLFQIFCSNNVTPLFVDFDEVENLVQSGEVDAGILLHEGQVLYKDWGLKKIIDLGEKWFNHTGLPIPLGLDVINRKFDDDLSSSIAKALKESIEYAHANEDKALEYALSYGRGISKENGRKFVRMYVNADTVNMGKEGEAALKRLFSLAFDKGIIDSIPELDFIRV